MNLQKKFGQDFKGNVQIDSVVNDNAETVNLPKKKEKPVNAKVDDEYQKILDLKKPRKGPIHSLSLPSVPLPLYCRIRKYCYEHGMSITSFFYTAAERYIDSLEGKD